MRIPLTVTTLPGLEPVLEEELHELGIQVREKGRQAISCIGTEESLYRLNLTLRTALRVLRQIHQANVQSVQELYREAKALPWEQFIHPNQTIAVSVSSPQVRWASQRYLPLVVKDAVVDRFSEIYGKRPSVDSHAPHLPIHLHLEGTLGSFSVDTSGESLHRRGYRTEKTEAPLSEVLAAGILKLIRWTKDVPLYDPMCGSGTFLVEAGLMAYCIPPGILRTRFAFHNWKDFNKALYEKVRMELEAPFKTGANQGKRAKNQGWNTKNTLIKENKKGEEKRPWAGSTCTEGSPLFGSDKDSKALEITQRNLIRAGLEGKVRLFQGSFGSSSPPFPPEQGGVVIMNPPYGKRLEDPSILALYKKIGDTLKQRYPGTEAWILSANPEALRHIGLRPFKKYALKNGPLDCTLVGFQLYAGHSRKP